MQSRNRHVAAVTLAVCATILVVGAWYASAGDLNPPVGPLAPTMKTLVEVEPRIAINATNTPGDANSLFKITQPGSYYLTGNITGVVGKHGIEIAASGVTLDLNGFDLEGVPGMGFFDGVSTTVVNLSNISVVNGSVRNWGEDGINMGRLPAFGCRVKGVRAADNAFVGIYAGDSCTASDCSATSNSGNGIIAGLGSTVGNCTATSNASNGISVGDGSTITDCSAYFNTGNGISVGDGSTISNCAVNFNALDGIRATDGSTITDCSATNNGATGINVSERCTVADCTIGESTFSGVFCFSRCVIRDNTCSDNGQSDGAGIHAAGIGNRIEGNNCTGADRGIDVDGGGNIIIRNTCRGNTTNWVIVPNNAVAPIVQASVNAATISSSSYNGNLGSTDPHANFSY